MNRSGDNIRKHRPFEPARVIILSTVLSALAVISLTLSCSKKEDFQGSLMALDSLVEESISLHSHLHPLRSSRLGITGSDSRLFTFSRQEIDRSLEKIDAILKKISTLPANHFDNDRLDESTMLIRWLQGEAYALKELQIFRTNPLIYTWMLEEALYLIPSRHTPPSEQEFEDYSKRLSRIPGLISNAGLLLDNPAKIVIGPAAFSTRSMLDDTGNIRKLIEDRYDSVPSSFDVAMESIETFHNFLIHDLPEFSHGRFILGTEVLSDIYRYSGQIDIEMEKSSAEAEKSISKYRSQINSIDRSPKLRDAGHPLTPGPGIRAMLDSIEISLDSKKVFGPIGKTPFSLIRRTPPPLHEILPVNPYLVVPYRKVVDIYSQGPALLSDEPCTRSIIVARGAERTSTAQLTYGLYGVSSAVWEAERRLCSDSTPAMRLLSGELFFTAWKIHNLKELSSMASEMKMKIRKIHLENKIHDLTMMIIVFRLHSGSFTVDSATDFVASTLNIPVDEAKYKVSIAAALPSAALPGIATIMADEMVKQASTVRGERYPRKRVRRKMLENYGKPFSLIMDEIKY
ncbi:MAG: hypothetical protein KAV42_05490 [Candidatus Krumholzibacteria bacterium]|nr:hypothetical protein [Candidatus Krumholzibacteria bacterium]